MNTIVVVNGEPSILEIVQRLLQVEGYHVRVFAHGLEALAAVNAEPADLLITDGSNYPMTGVELVRRLRHVSDVPVVFLTAWAWELREELRGTELEAHPFPELSSRSECGRCSGGGVVGYQAQLVGGDNASALCAVRVAKRANVPRPAPLAW